MDLLYFTTFQAAMWAGNAYVRSAGGDIGGQPDSGGMIALAWHLLGSTVNLLLIALLVAGFIRLAWWEPIAALLASIFVVGGLKTALGSYLEDSTVALFVSPVVVVLCAVWFSI